MNTELMSIDTLKNLKNEIQQLRLQLARLIQERDELNNIVCPELTAKYMSIIGELDLDVMQLRQTILELKFRISLAQAARNREETYSQEAADQQVEEKYGRYQEEINQKRKQTERFREEQEERERKRRQYQENRNIHMDSEAADDTCSDHNDDSARENTSERAKKEASEHTDIKTLYKKIIKRLHPDMNKGREQTKREKELFVQAVEAYQYGDIQTLERIWNESFYNLFI